MCFCKLLCNTDCLASALDLLNELSKSEDLKKFSEVWVLSYCYHNINIRNFSLNCKEKVKFF